MTTQNFKVLFILPKNKVNWQNKSFLYCRITFQGKRSQFSTGILLEVDHWDAKSQTIVKRNKNAQQYNYQLEEIKSKILTSFLICVSRKTPFTVTEIYEQYIGKDDQKTEAVTAYYKLFLAKLKKLVGLQLKENTYNKFVYVGNHLDDYIKQEFKNDVQLKDLKESFLNGFIFYLIVEKKQAQVTINKTVQRFRTAIKQAIIEGYLEKDPFMSYKPKKTRKEVIFLSREELFRLQYFEFKQKRLALIKNLFIFCCYTGLAYREMADLKKGNVQVGFDGFKWIKILREKTRRPLSIPILPIAQEIIDLYISEADNIFPSVRNQTFNSYLKEIAEIVGIDKTLTHHTARKTFASTVLLYNDVPMEIVSELLGHSNMSITQESYGKVVQTKIGQTMTELSKRLEKNDDSKPTKLA